MSTKEETLIRLAVLERQIHTLAVQIARLNRTAGHALSPALEALIHNPTNQPDKVKK